MMEKILAICFVFFAFVSCSDEPKIVSESEKVPSTGVFSSTESKSKMKKQSHQVKVKEIMKTSKYVYMLVSEGNKEFWVATGLKDIDVGAIYTYDDGLLQTNFVSKEFNRTFDEIYLVMNFDLADGSQGHNLPSNTTHVNKNVVKLSIKELVENSKKYKGQMVQVSGNCIKLNEQIMGKNWMHLVDGTKDDFDLLITSTKEAVPKGQKVTMKGIVVLDKDFGAGYKYDILLENGAVVK